MSEEFFYNLSVTQYKLVHDIYDKLDDKISDIIKTNLTFITINFGIGYFLIDKFLSVWSTIPFIMSISFLTWSTILGLINRKPLDIDYLHPLEFYNRHYNEDLIDIIETASVTIGDSIYSIEDQCKSKANLLRDMINNQIKAVILISASFIILIIDFFI